MIEIKTCQFVESSELFKGLSRLFNAYLDCGPSFSFGDTNRTFVLAQDLICDIAHLGVADSRELAVEYNTLQKRINSIGLSMYVDLEN